MFDIFKKLLLSRQLTFEKGEMGLLGQPVVFVPVQMFAYVVKHTKNSKEFGELVYQGCRLASVARHKRSRSLAQEASDGPIGSPVHAQAGL